jgi:hypothetical protein
MSPSGRRSAIDRHTTRHVGYAISQRKRPLVEEIFGWMKTIGGFRRTRFIGLERTQLAGYFVAAAYNLVRIARLMPAAASSQFGPSWPRRSTQSRAQEPPVAPHQRPRNGSVPLLNRRLPSQICTPQARDCGPRQRISPQSDFGPAPTDARPTRHASQTVDRSTIEQLFYILWISARSRQRTGSYRGPQMRVMAIPCSSSILRVGSTCH